MRWWKNQTMISAYLYGKYRKSRKRVPFLCRNLQVRSKNQYKLVGDKKLFRCRDFQSRNKFFGKDEMYHISEIRTLWIAILLSTLNFCIVGKVKCVAVYLRLILKLDHRSQNWKSQKSSYRRLFELYRRTQIGYSQFIGIFFYLSRAWFLSRQEKKVYSWVYLLFHGKMVDLFKFQF